MTRGSAALCATLVCAALGCGDGRTPVASPPLQAIDAGVDSGQPDAEVIPTVLQDDPLRISEVMSSNDGAWLDERGEADDFIELVNVGAEPLDLAAYVIGDQPGKSVPLPTRSLGPGEFVVLFADDEPEQGPLHLP